MSQEKFVMKRRDGMDVHGLAWPIENAIGNVIIITGMEEHAQRYDHFATYLNERGYSVYCIDHYGQGENAKAYDNLGKWEKSGFRIMVNTIDTLVNKLRITCRPIYIVAHSMGSFILQDFIQRYSAHVDKVVLVGSCGSRSAVKFANFLMKFMVNNKNYDKPSKFLDKLVFGSNNKKTKHRTEKDWISLSESNVDAYISDPYCGYGVTRGFYKEMFKGISRLNTKRFLKKIRKNLPILIVSGEDDPVGLYGKGVKKLYKQYVKLGIEDVELKLYPNLRHEVLNEDNKEEIYDEIIKFLKK